MIIDLQTEDAGIDPVKMINLPSVVSHTDTGSSIDTTLSSLSIDFDGSISTSVTTPEALSLNWIEATEDFICYLNGICDKRYYDAETIDVPVKVASATVAMTTPWDSYINSTPSVVFYRDNLQEYAVKSWQNLKVEIDPLSTVIEGGDYVVTGTGQMIGREVSYVNSTYSYLGAASLDEEGIFTVNMDQTVDSVLGEAHMIWTLWFDTADGEGQQTITACYGPGMLCGAVNQDIAAGNNTTPYAAQNLVVSEDMETITWDYSIDVDLGEYGVADSDSSFTAIYGELTCTDADGDGYYLEGGACGTDEDCNDSDANVHPDAQENPFALADMNCNGNIFCFIGTANFFGSN
jgi:hypothetical protein